MPMDEILFEAEEHMEKALEHLKHELSGLRTGRASTNLVDRVKGFAIFWAIRKT